MSAIVLVRQGLECVNAACIKTALFGSNNYSNVFEKFIYENSKIQY